MIILTAEARCISFFRLNYQYAISNMKNFRFSTTISVAAAFCAYFIGSGFASGQEALQYFAAYGGIWPIFIPLIVFACLWFFWSKIGYNSWEITSADLKERPEWQTF